MIIRTVGGIRYFQSELLDRSVLHAFFSRQGGVSPEPWASLNLGGTVGDESDRVRENRRLALTSVALDLSSVFDVWQVHGTTVAVAEAPRLPDEPHQQADGIITDQPGLTLMMRFADCVPILLHDPVHRAIGIAHAGWLGTVLGTVRYVVQAMRSNYDSRPEDLVAVIGPSIGPDHYEVGLDVVNRVKNAFKTDSGVFITSKAGHSYFDLWAANRWHIKESGVRRVDLMGLCTACHLDDWYSHRAEHGRTGRFGVIIRLV